MVGLMIWGEVEDPTLREMWRTAQISGVRGNVKSPIVSYPIMTSCQNYRAVVFEMQSVPVTAV
jgi:hypothetical protein